jgi:hypothetical protein
MITLAAVSWGTMNHPQYSSELGPIDFSIVLTTEGIPGRADIQETS